MLVVIDESGCAGFEQGSSTHFVLAMIIFDSFADAEQTANTIHAVKRTLGMKREFKFSSCTNERQDAFFEAIKHSRFNIRLFVVEKRLIHSNHLREVHEAFVSYCLKHLMQSATTRINQATFKIDGSGSRKFKRECQSYLRQHVTGGIIKKLKFCDSENDVLVQLADMVVSAYARPYNNPDKHNAYRWRNMIERKIENIWNFR